MFTGHWPPRFELWAPGIALRLCKISRSASAPCRDPLVGGGSDLEPAFSVTVGASLRQSEHHWRLSNCNPGAILIDNYFQSLTRKDGHPFSNFTELKIA